MSAPSSDASSIGMLSGHIGAFGPEIAHLVSMLILVVLPIMMLAIGWAVFRAILHARHVAAWFSDDAYFADDDVVADWTYTQEEMF